MTKNSKPNASLTLHAWQLARDYPQLVPRREYLMIDGNSVFVPPLRPRKPSVAMVIGAVDDK